MLAAGVHFGHQTKYWNPKMSPFIFGARNNIHIINLDKTLPAYMDALKRIEDVCLRKPSANILFIGTKRSCARVVREEARRAGMPYVDQRWLGGMLTNYKTIRQSVKVLRDLEEDFKNGKFSKLKKREALQRRRKMDKLERSLGGIKDMNGLPDMIFVLDVSYEQIAIAEANKLRIPVIGVVDTDSNPDGVDAVIPGNDDSIRAAKLYLTGVADMIISAKHVRAIEDEAQEKQKAKAAKQEARQSQSKAKDAAKDAAKDEGKKGDSKTSVDEGETSSDAVEAVDASAKVKETDNTSSPKGAAEASSADVKASTDDSNVEQSPASEGDKVSDSEKDNKKEGS